MRKPFIIVPSSARLVARVKNHVSSLPRSPSMGNPSLKDDPRIHNQSKFAANPDDPKRIHQTCPRLHARTNLQLWTNNKRIPPASAHRCTIWHGHACYIGATTDSKLTGTKSTNHPDAFKVSRSKNTKINKFSFQLKFTWNKITEKINFKLFPSIFPMIKKEIPFLRKCRFTEACNDPLKEPM